MFSYCGMTRNPFRFLITPNASLVVSDVWFPLSDSRVPAAFWNFVRSDGGDIRVLAQDGVTQLPCQLVGFNATTKVGSLFIKAGAATAFYVCFGNRQWVAPAANATYGKYATWETAAKGIWHMDVDANDSTVNQNNGTTTLSHTTGQVGQGYAGDSTHYITVPKSSSFEGMSGLTLSMWAQSDTLDTKHLSYWEGASGRFFLRGLSRHLVFFTWTTTGPLGVTQTASYPTTGWHLYHAVYDGSAMLVYQDGVQQSVTGGQTGSIVTGGTNNVIMGAEFSLTLAQNGALDEGRIIARPYSPAECAQHFANQSAPGTFWASVGGVQQV